MKRAVLVLVVSVLVAPASAPAKGPVSLEICGVSACTTIRHRENEQLVFGVLELETSFSFASAPALSPYYELEVRPSWEDESEGETPLYYVPSRNVVRVENSWVNAGGRLGGALRAATRGLRPWPRPELTAVLVGDRETPEPAQYAPLFAELPPAEPAPYPAKTIDIVARAERPSPWTISRRPIEYVPSEKVLHRDGEWVAAPTELVYRIAADLGGPGSQEEGRRTAWLSYVALLVLVVGAAGIAWLRLRRRRRSPRAWDGISSSEVPSRPRK